MIKSKKGIGFELIWFPMLGFTLGMISFILLMNMTQIQITQTEYPGQIQSEIAKIDESTVLTQEYFQESTKLATEKSIEEITSQKTTLKGCQNKIITSECYKRNYQGFQQQIENQIQKLFNQKIRKYIQNYPKEQIQIGNQLRLETQIPSINYRIFLKNHKIKASNNKPLNYKIEYKNQEIGEYQQKLEHTNNIKYNTSKIIRDYHKNIKETTCNIVKKCKEKENTKECMNNKISNSGYSQCYGTSENTYSFCKKENNITYKFSLTTNDLPLTC